MKLRVTCPSRRKVLETGGSIGLQCNQPGSEVAYRNIRIREPGR